MRDWRTEFDEAIGPLRVDQLDAVEGLLRAYASEVRAAVVAEIAKIYIDNYDWEVGHEISVWLDGEHYRAGSEERKGEP